MWIADESRQRDRFAQKARFRITKGRFEEVEALEESLRVSGECWPSGVPKALTVGARAFDHPLHPDDPQAWLDHLESIRTWVQARPNSILAPIALAEALTGRGWEARGTKWASQVGENQWERMAADLDEASLILDQCPPKARENPLWWLAKLRVLHGQGSARDAEFRATCDEALRRFPECVELYERLAMHLMPRWHGGPGELAREIDRRTRALPDSIADEYYARAIGLVATYSKDVFEENSGLRWDRIEKGIAQWHRHCPESQRPIQVGALLATMSRHWEMARGAFEAMGDTLDMETWDSGPRFQSYRYMAYQNGESPK